MTLKDQEKALDDAIKSTLIAMRDVVLSGYGEVTAIIRGGKVTRVVKTEEIKLD